MRITNTVREFTEVSRLLRWVSDNTEKALLAGPVVCTLGRETRSIDQNAKLWPILEDVASQCDAIINGEAVKVSKEDWKNIFTSSLCSQARIARGIDGGVVFLGESTSRMSKKKFCDLIEVIYAYGASKGVIWSEKAASIYETYRQAQQ